MLDAIRDFVRPSAASGLFLIAAAVIAIVAANTPAAGLYDALIDTPVELRIGEFQIAKPLLLWINDGLMAVFFFVVGLELKREFVEGELADPSRVLFPALGAFGGMLVPSLIYVAINRGDALALEGWAIPAATDIAFALAILALLGDRVPLTLRIFLVSVAIFDDVGAIVIIALFYTSNLSVLSLAVAGCCLPLLFWLNRRAVKEKAPYVLVGLVMWAALLKSGVHATLAGVLLAFFIPIRDPEAEVSPLHELEHDLHGAVAFGILPLFAFANAGISIGGVSLDSLFHPVTLGIFAGLLLGKQTGVFVFCWLGVRLGLARLPEGLGWPVIYGAAVLCGIGFTMSLFIGSLAFEGAGLRAFDERLGIVLGSALSAVCGYVVLRTALGEERHRP